MALLDFRRLSLERTVQIQDMKNTRGNDHCESKPSPRIASRAGAQKIASFVGKEENRITDIPGVSLHRRTAPTPPCRMTYHPGIIVVAQGSKQVNLGSDTALSTTSRASS